MMRRKKRAYLATLAILGALGGLAYYANSQSKHYELNVDMYNLPSKLKTQSDPVPAPTPAPLPPPAALTPVPVPQPPQTVPEKSKTFIIELDQYTTKTQAVSVPKGYNVNLLIKVDRFRSGEGLSFQAPGQPTVLVKPGETKTLSFQPETNFVLDVYLGTSTVNAPYAILINIE